MADKQNFYPRSPCGERPIVSRFVIIVKKISIHVPLAGNVGEGQGLDLLNGISIHVPLAGNVV